MFQLFLGLSVWYSHGHLRLKLTSLACSNACVCQCFLLWPPCSLNQKPKGHPLKSLEAEMAAGLRRILCCAEAFQCARGLPFLVSHFLSNFPQFDLHPSWHSKFSLGSCPHIHKSPPWGGGYIFGVCTPEGSVILGHLRILLTAAHKSVPYYPLFQILHIRN